MFSRKHISLFLILLMLGAQLALARHATVHFAEEQVVAALDLQTGAESPADHGHDHGPRLNDLCQLCLFAKDFGHTLTTDNIVLPASSVKDTYRAPPTQNHITRQASHGYLARAPPAFLI